MMRKMDPKTYRDLNRCLAKDSARSYFIRLGLLDDKIFHAVYADMSDTGVLKGILCQRRSGTLQYWSDGNEDIAAISAVMEDLQWDRFISPLGCCKELISEGVLRAPEPGAWIASLKAISEPKVFEDVESLCEEDLKEVNALYGKVFEHHMPLEQMQDKLSSGRGRGVVIRRQGRIVGVAQTEFEGENSCLIVGVATDPIYQRQGIAEACTARLCMALLGEGKVPWLQYDNPAAGYLYEKLGFEEKDRVMHCRR